LLAAGAVVTDSGGLTDEAALTAAALGIPLVLGTREGTRRFTTGTLLHVDTRNGTVVPA
jgi:pyruvate,water dikinase